MVYGARSSKDEKSYTYLKKIFEAIDNKQKDYNWLITNYECYPRIREIEEIFKNREYCWLSGEELTEIIEKDDFQWVWGILSGFDKSIGLSEILECGLPCEDNYNEYFKNPLSLQHPLASTEIVPFDSSYVMILSKDKEIVDSFMKIYSCSDDLVKANSEN